ncbi:MAG: hypothetical protein P8Y44_08980, partial [Acidobacteriota bacterium]
MTSHCVRTREVLRSHPADYSQSLRQHIAKCAICSDALAVESFMQSASSGTPALNHLPNPSTIWWRSRYLARQRRVDRATRPIRLVEQFGLIVGTAGSAIAATLVWPQLKSSVTGWLSSLAAETQGAAQISP